MANNTRATGRVAMMATAFAAIVSFDSACAYPDTASATVHTDKGAVTGSISDDGRQFLGIPYAAPPVGALRWKPPAPVAAWQQARNATQFGGNCPQFGTPFGLQSFNEDCLYLNVYTPPADAKRKRLFHSGRDPVMVWLHPGAYQFGEGDDYDPRKLVAEGVVVVTLNYRLGALGFLAHPALSAESPRSTSGNYAIMDQQAALRWVQKNIARFGGDPHNVTIFGASAGGLSVHAHLASPQSKGLFHRAIAQSAAYSLTLPTLAAAESEGELFATAVGCASQDAACLRNVDVVSVLTNQRPGILGFLPNIDPDLLPLSIGEAFEKGQFNRVPVIVGSTHDEYRLFLPLFFDFVSGPLTPELYPVGISIVLGVPPTAVPGIMAQYPLANYPSPSIALGAVATDAVFACNMQTTADSLSKYVPTWVYEFNDDTAPQRYLPPASFPYGASHEADLQYLFDIVTTLPSVSLNADQEKLSKVMVNNWANFAQTGNPNSLVSIWAPPIWYRYNRTDYVQRLDSPRPEAYSGSAFSNDHKCAFWKASATN
jgi:para-nitrobenzyl esterase